jgi:hypothetical protein
VDRAILRRGELHEGGVGAGRDDVDGRPAGALDEVLRRPGAEGDHALGQVRAERVGAVLGPIVGDGDAVGLPAEVAAHHAPDGVLLVDLHQPHGVGERGLGVEVDGQNPVAVERRGVGEMLGHHALADAALEVGHRGAEGAARRARGQQPLAAHAQPPAQRLDLLQREPALPAVLGQHLALGQGGVLGEPAAQRVRRHVEHEAANLPDRERPQRLDLFGREGGAADFRLLRQAAPVEPAQESMIDLHPVCPDCSIFLSR